MLACVSELSPLPTPAPSRTQLRLLDRLLAEKPRPRHRYPLAVLAVAITTGISFALHPLLPLVGQGDTSGGENGGGNIANLIMLHLLAVVITATRLGSGPAILASMLGITTCVYFFVPHYYSLILEDIYYLPTFVIMLTVSLLVSALTARLRSEALATEERELRTRAMYELSRELAAVESKRDLARVVAASTAGALRCRGSVLECAGAELRPLNPEHAPRPATVTAAASCRADRQTRSVDGAWLLPLVVANEVVGVLACEHDSPDSLGSPADHQLVQSFAHNVAVTLHRLAVADEAATARMHADEERLRNVMLSSVSHDLRTPLASITGAVTTLIDSGARIDDATRLDLMQAIRDDATALERQVRNMLDLTRLESGTLRIRRDWHSLEEVVGCALARVESQLVGRDVPIDFPRDLPLVHLDAMLIEQLLVNLLENAVRYTPKGSPITIGAACRDEQLLLTVADRGPGIPQDEQERVFTKFYRGTTPRSQPGSGLGLAICRAIAQLHGGEIHLADRPGGGTTFTVQLPTGGAEPEHPAESDLALEKTP